MKEFNRWIDKECPGVEDYCPQCPEIAADAWKAALEWALEQETWIGPDDGGEEGIALCIIEEELNE